MRHFYRAASISIFSGALAVAASSFAFAQDAKLSTCVDMRNQVNTALADNAQSPKYEDAKKQQQYGTEFCGSGLYQNGVSHYAEALKLLGASKS